MYLAPQHFQAQRHHFESSLAHTVDALFRFSYGWTRVVLDADALSGGTLVIAHARGILPDATAISVPDIDPAPPPSGLADRFAPDRDSHIVHLALSAWRPNAANVNGIDEAGHVTNDARFVKMVSEVRDETTGQDAAEVHFASKNLRLVLDVELSRDDVSLPVARIRRDGAGRFIADPDYVPPCLHIAASEWLLGIVRSTLAMLKAKGEALAASMGGSLSGGAGGPAAYVGNEVATRWLLHAVRSAEPTLQHLLDVRAVHPEHAWVEMSRLAGALCTFSLGTDARDLPTYAHDDLGGCFAALVRHLRAHFDVVVASRAVVVRLERAADTLYVGAVADPRCYQAGARWFLGVRAALPQAELLARAPELLKVCSSKFVMELVRRAFPGFALEHMPSPPPGLAPRRELVYFEIQMAGPCAQSTRDLRELGVYVPDGLPDVELELAVLVPT
jgi:type VI secretion system protein ImpJ